MFRAFTAKMRMGAKKVSKTSVLKDEDGQKSSDAIVIDLGLATKKGKMHNNEDRAIIVRRLSNGEEMEKKEGETPLPVFQMSNVKYIAVFDGHGGSQCAAFMRERLHEHILDCMQKDNGGTKCQTFQDLRFYLPDAFKAADDEFCEMYFHNTSGACGVIALIHGREILVAHVGDCRAVLRCNSETYQLTRDHRPSNLEEMRRVVSMGGKIVDGRVGGVLSPSRSFGDTDVRAEFGDGIVISEPDISYVTLEADDTPDISRSQTEERSKSTASTTTNNVSPYTFLLLCSDGIFEAADCETACDVIETSLRRFGGDAAKAAERLVRFASGQSQDDCTAIVAVWREEVAPTRAKSQRYLLPLQKQQNNEEDEDVVVTRGDQ